MPTPTKQTLGWIGTGRMGYAMAERLAKGGCDIAVWNRTKAKAEPLTKHGAKVVNQLEELSTKDILFVMVSTYEDVKEVIGKALAAGRRVQYRWLIGSSSAGNSVITLQPLSVTTTSSSMRAAE